MNKMIRRLKRVKHPSRIIGSIILLISIAIFSFVYLNGENSISGRFTNNDDVFEVMNINSTFVGNQNIILDKEITSLKITSSFKGDGSARIYALSGDKKILIYEFVGKTKHEFTSVGFVTYNSTLEPQIGTEELNSTIDFNESVIYSDQNISKEIIGDSIGNSSKNITQDKFNEVEFNDSSVNDSSIVISVIDQLDLNESINNYSDNASFENVSVNENNTIDDIIDEIVVENVSVEVSNVVNSVVDGCLESCALLPVIVDSIAVDVVGGDLFISTISYRVNNKEVSDSSLSNNLTINIGSFELIDLNNYFFGNYSFYDFSSSNGYSYEINNGVLKIIPESVGVWPARAYAVLDDGNITSFDFVINIVNPLNLLNNLSALTDVVVIENSSYNVTINESDLETINESSNTTNTNISEILPFEIDPTLQEYIDNSSNDNSVVRVIIKYKDESANSVSEYIDNLKDSSELLLNTVSSDINNLMTERTDLLNELNVAANIDAGNITESNVVDVGAVVIENVSDLIVAESNLTIEELKENISAIDEKINDVAFAEMVVSSNVIVESSVLDAGIESVSLNITNLEVLKDNNNIEKIYLDSPVSLLFDGSSEIIKLNDAKDYVLNVNNLSLDGNGSKICFVDSGVNLDVVNYSFGFDFVDNDSVPNDVHGHGTSVGHILKLMSPASELIVVKVIGETGVAYQSDVIAGLQYCQDQNVSVVSLSLGGGSFSGFCDEDILAQKVNELSDSGILVVAATGNDGSSSLIKSPACASSALAVGASTKSDELALFTNFNGNVLLLAPGQDILTKNIVGGDVLISGTSMSVPFVSGGSALLISSNSQNFAQMSVDEKKNYLVHTGDILNITLGNETSENNAAISNTRLFSRLNLFNAVSGNITNNLSYENVFTNETMNYSVGPLYSSISFESPTPSDGSNVYSPNQSIVANISESGGGNTSAWIDFDGSLVAYWAMDFYNSSGVFDNSTYKYNGTFMNGLSSSNITAGVRGNDIDFDGVNDGLSMGDVLDLGTSDYSYSMWIKMRSSTRMYFFEKGAVSGNNGTRIETGTDMKGGATFGYNSSYVGNIYGATLLNDSLWHHIVVTFDRDGNGIWYTDGVAGTPVSIAAGNGQNINTAANLYVGSLSASRYVNGSMDEVMVFNRVLSQSEILALYNSQVNKFNVTFTNLSYGQHNYTLYVVNASGNRNNSGQRTFTYSNITVLCGTISVANSVINLTVNISNSSTCFTVSASNVTIDCNGYSIIGNNTSSTYGVYSNQFNTTVKNCIINNYSRGVYFDGADNGTVDNVSVTTTGSHGIYVANGANYNVITDSVANSQSNYGIYVSGGVYNFISGSSGISTTAVGLFVSNSNFTNVVNSVGNSTSGVGFEVINSNFSNINDSNGTSLGAERGIYVESSSNGFIDGALGVSNALIGLDVSGSYNVSVNNSRGVSNTSYGLRLVSSSNCFVYNSNGTSNTSMGFVLYLNANNNYVSNVNATSLGGGYSLRIDTSHNNTINMSSSFSNSGLGVYLDGGSSNNTLINSVFTSNSGVVFYLENGTGNILRNNSLISTNKNKVLLDIGTTANNNIVCLNNFTNTSDYYVYDRNGSNLFNCSYGALNQGNIYYNILNRSVDVKGSTSASVGNLYVGSSGAGYPYNSSTSLNKVTSGVVDYAPLTNVSSIVPCSTLSVANAVINLTNNITSSGTCFSVSAVNVTIDCRGFSLSGNNSSTTYGVYSNVFNTSVRNCFISNFTYGVYLSRSNYGSFENNVIVVSSNSSGSAGILLSESNFSRVVNNSVFVEFRSGVRLIGNSCNNYVSNLNVTTVNGLATYSGYGLTVEASFNNTIVNSSSFAPDSVGIDIFSGSSYNSLIGCNGTSDSYRGIVIYSDSNYNFVTDSIGASNSGFGVYLYGASNNTLNNVVAISGSSFGMYVSTGSYYNLINRSIMSSTSNIGLYVNAGSNYTRILDSMGNSSTNVGIEVLNSNNTNIMNSNGTSVGNNYGIYLSNADHGFIINSRGVSFSNNGIYVLNSDNNTINNSVGFSNSSNGVLLQGSSNNFIYNSIGASGSGDAFIFYLGSNNNLVSNCSSSTSGLSLRVNNAHNNTFSGFSASSNSNVAVYVSGVASPAANNSFIDSNFVSNSTTVLQVINGTGNLFRNNTFTSTPKSQILFQSAARSGNNILCLNNFTNTSGYYVSDSNGSNYFNCTYGGLNQGNIYYNILNGSIDVRGYVPSTISTLRIGSSGSGVPYNSSTSLNKVSSGVVDYAPLTLPELVAPTVGQTSVYQGLTYFNGSIYFYKGSVNISVNASDVGVGINTTSCMYTKDGSTYSLATGYNGSHCYQTNIDDAMNRTFNFKVNDLEGNIGTGTSRAYVYDATFPNTTASAIVSNGTSYTFGSVSESSYVNVTLSCNDSGGVGCNVTYYCTDLVNSCTPTTVYSGVVQISNVGTSYIRFYSNDTLNNLEPAQNKTVIVGSDCQTFSTPNAVYTLVSNVTSIGTCFTISNGASNVTINCNNYWIIYSTAGLVNNWGIRSTANYTNINNCNILDGNFSSTNSRPGIYLSSTFNSTIYNNFVFVNKSSAIVVENSKFSNLTNNNFVSNSSIGLSLSSSNNSVLNLNNGTSDSSYGIYLLSSFNNILTFNNGGSNVSRAISISSSSNNILTSNNGVSDSGYGFIVESSSNNTLFNISAMSNSATALRLSSVVNSSISNSLGISNSASEGIYLGASSTNNIINNSMGVSLNGSGIQVSTSSGNLFVNCIGNGTSTGFSNNVGMFFSASNSNRVVNCTLQTIGAAALRFDKSSYNNISDTRAYSNSSRGLELENSSFNFILNITATSNTSQAVLFTRYYDGTGLTFNNTVVNSTFQSGSNYAIRLLNCTDNTFIGNKLISSGGASTLLYVENSSYDNYFYLNNFTSTSSYYVNDLNGSNFYNGTYAGLNQGNIWYNVINGSVDIRGSVNSSVGGLYVGSSGYGYPYNSSTSLNKVNGNVTDYASLTNVSSIISCGNLSTANFVLNLTSNLLSVGTCFNVSVANVTIDCAGFSLIGDNSSGSYGVYSNKFNTTIKNCIINNFSTGIYFNAAPNGTISNVSVSTTQNWSNSEGVGIYLFNSSNYTLVVNSSGVSFSGMGIWSHLSNFTTINDSYGSSLGSKFGIYFNNSYRGFISGSRGVSGSGTGIYLYSSSNNTINNTKGVSNSQWGFLLWGSSGNVVMNCNGTSTSNTGFTIYLNSNGNVFTNILGSSDSYYGLRVNWVYNNSISNSVAVSNSNYGLYMDGGSSGNNLTDSNFTSSTNIVFNLVNGVNNLFRNDSFVSTAKNKILVNVNAVSGNNIFCLNNFTNTSDYYVNDSNSSNFYNCTYSGLNQGNAWHNILNGSINVRGTVNSSVAGLYVGSSGTGIPYNSSTSQTKLNGVVFDYVPLTNILWTNTAPVMNFSRILPSVAYVNSTLIGYCSANDSDGDNVSYYYQWYKNGAANASGWKWTSTNFTQNTEINVANITSSNLVASQNWSLGCRAFDGTANSTLWLNSSVLTINNSAPPKVNLSYPLNNDTNFINRTPRFNWTNVADLDGDSVTYNIVVSTFDNFSDIIYNVSGIINNYYDSPTELQFRNYYWKVKANDGLVDGNWSDTWNFTLVTYVSVQMIVANVSFNALNPMQSDNTTDDSPPPYLVKSFSNTYIDAVNLTVSDSLWISQPLNTSYWQMKVRSKSDGSFNESGSKTSFFNVTNTSYIVRNLNYSNSRNNVSIDVGVTGPAYEPAGAKHIAFNLDWEVAS